MPSPLEHVAQIHSEHEKMRNPGKKKGRSRQLWLARCCSFSKGLKIYFCIMSCTNSLSASPGLAKTCEACGFCQRSRLTVNTSVAILVRLADHLIHLFIRKLLADRGHDVSQLGSRYEPVVVTIENLKNVRLAT